MRARGVISVIVIFSYRLRKTVEYFG